MKKWTYLVAAGMMLGATPVFTGCIDNDEPEGISILRGAKAELLRARVAVESANAARILAEASYIKAQEELVAAQAEKVRAKAEKIRKEAELLAAKNEAEIAKIQAEINKLNQEAHEAEVRVQQLLQEIAAAMQAAEDAHNIALQELAKAKVTATEAQWNALKPWRDAYDKASEAYFEKTKAVLEAQNALMKAEADKEVSIADKRAAERQLLIAQNELKDAKEALDKLNQKLEDAGKLQPGEIPAEIESLEAQIKEKEQAIAKVEVEKQEAKRDNPAYAKLADLEKAKDEIKDEKVAIAPFKNTINPDEAAYWGYELDEEIVGEGAYTHNDDTEYWNAWQKLNNYKSFALKYQLDEDDVKWNEALINEKNIELEALKKDFEEFEALFNAAVKAYNEGKGVDVTAYINYDKLVDGVKLYNDEADKLDAQKKVVEEKYQLWVTADEAYREAAADQNLYTAWSIYRAALAEANQKQQDANAAADKAYNDVMDPLRNKQDDALELYMQRDREEALALANLNADPENEALKKAYETAQNNTAQALTAWSNASKAYQDAQAKEEPKRTNAKKVAAAQRNLDNQLAQNNYSKAQREWEDGIEPAFAEKLSNLKKTRDDAYEAYNAECEKIDYQPVYDALSALNDIRMSIDIATNARYYDRNSWNNEFNTALRALIYANEECYDLDITKLFVVTDAKGYLKYRSGLTYGGLAADMVNDTNNGWPGERITSLDREGVNEIIATYFPKEEKRYYHMYYGNFRKLGEILDKEVEIEIGKSYIANSDKFKTLIQEVDEAMTALEASLEKQMAAVEEAEEAWKAQEEVVSDIEKEFVLKSSTLTSERDLLDDILEAYKAVPLEGEEKYTAKSIEQLKKRLQSKIDEQEETIFDKQTAVEIYQNKVETLGKPEATEVDAAKFDLQIAELEKERAKTLLDKAEEELNAAIAAILGE